MSQWRLILREVYQAGGRMPVQHMGHYDDQSLRLLRKAGLVAPCTRGSLPGGRRPPVVLTQMGIDVVEGRLEMYVPYMGHGPTRGRAKGSHRRWKASWLAALPRANEIRLTACVHPAQTPSTC